MKKPKSILNERELESLLCGVFELKALTHPVRLEIMNLLYAKKRMTVGELCEVMGLEQPQVSLHLKLLRRYVFVFSEKKTRNVYYSINSEKVERFKNLSIMFSDDN